MKRVLCVGDACADLLIPYGHARNGREAKVGFAPGGTVANTASGLGRLGADCAFAGVAGQDEYGEEMKNSLALDGVDVSRFRLREGLSSTMVMVVLDENQERYPFLLPRDRQAHLELRREDLPESLLEGVDYVHTSGLMLFENPAAEAVCAFLELCKRRGGGYPLISTCGWRPPEGTWGTSAGRWPAPTTCWAPPWTSWRL